MHSTRSLTQVISVLLNRQGIERRNVTHRTSVTLKTDTAYRQKAMTALNNNAKILNRIFAGSISIILENKHFPR